MNSLVQPVSDPHPGGGREELVAVDTLVKESDLVDDLIAASSETRAVLAKIARFAPYGTTLLIQGESGTGKELAARAVHRLSSVNHGPFVVFNCSNLVESLAESQLFGHVKGAFTDARDDSPGYFRAANGGTLFLDEVGELPLRLQPKLLRALEAHEVQPVGSPRTCAVKVRVVAATNRDLLQMVRSGEFRADLYYRLNAGSITLAPLRARRTEIRPLVGHLVRKFDVAFGRSVTHITRRALEALEQWPWPGNVRELAHAVESAVLLTDNRVIGMKDLPGHLSAAELEEVLPQPSSDPFEAGSNCGETDRAALESFDLQEALDSASKRALERALHHSSGNYNRAARLLGVSRFTVYRMMNRYSLKVVRQCQAVPA